MLGHNTTSYKCKQCRQLRPVSDLSHILSHTCAHISAHDKKPYYCFFYAYTRASNRAGIRKENFDWLSDDVTIHF